MQAEDPSAPSHFGSGASGREDAELAQQVVQLAAPPHQLYGLILTFYARWREDQRCAGGVFLGEFWKLPRPAVGQAQAGCEDAEGHR